MYEPINLGSHTIAIVPLSEGTVSIDLYHDLADSTERATVNVNTVQVLQIIKALAEANIGAIG